MIPALIDHLWQSSLFAACAWLVARRYRDHGAHLRYWIWFAASVKFLLPFSLLVSAGAWFSQHAISITAQSPIAYTIHEVVAPVVTPSVYVSARHIASDWLPALEVIAISIWAIGFLGLIARWLMQWLSIGSAIRSATPNAAVKSVPVMTSSMLHEPGVVGMFRPVLLLPQGITERLTREQLHAILDHELCHVRRRDNLTSAIHMLVEAVFWFNPLVWWIGARLVEERERA